MQQFLLVHEAGRFSLKLIREHAFPSQTEGMVADNELGWLYVGEEVAGIWKLPLKPTQEGEAGTQVQATLPKAHTGSPQSLVADVEGISLYTEPNGRGYLVVSIQGNFSYAVFDRAGDNDYLSSFKLVGGAVDGLEETDGLEVVSTPLRELRVGAVGPSRYSSHRRPRPKKYG